MVIHDDSDLVSCFLHHILLKIHEIKSHSLGPLTKPVSNAQEGEEDNIPLKVEETTKEEAKAGEKEDIYTLVASLRVAGKFSNPLANFHRLYPLMAEALLIHAQYSTLNGAICSRLKSLLQWSFD